MALNTSDFDAKISDLTSQIETAQKNIDNDPFGIQFASLKAKSDVLGSLQNQLRNLQLNKVAAISLQDQIDSSMQQLDTLKASAK